MLSRNTIRLAGRVLIVVVIAGSGLVTAAIGLAAKRGPDYSGSQNVRKGDGKKYKLLVRIEPPSDEPQEGPRLALTVRNESRAVIYVVDTGSPWDFKLDLRDSFDRIVPPRKDGRQPFRDGGKRSLVPVPPGQEVTITIKLADLYDLPGGEYSLTVKRTVFLRNKRTMVEIESDPVSVIYP